MTSMQVLAVDNSDITPEHDTAADSGTARDAKPLPDLHGEVAFESPETHVQRTVELLGAGAVVVNVPPPPPSARTQLAEHIGERIERELAARGAPSPYLAAWSSMSDEGEALLADQLFRARTVGATGIAILVGSLAAVAKPALSPEDSATLRLLARTTVNAPLVLLVDDGDLGARGYAEPVRLDTLLVPRAVEAQRTAEETVEVASHDELVVVETELPSIAPGPSAVGPSNFWRGWARTLGDARGSQPLASLERLFTENYVPLANAIASGLEDPRALRASDEFRRSFERTYGDAFATFGMTGRRPRLVMDAYDIASKTARLHHARTTHVLVVDSMRYDLGCMVRDALARSACATVSLLASEMLLWSALPTTTFRQLETLARGMEALREPVADDGSESLRGRVAQSVRRLRVGSRELYKLDIVPAMLKDAFDQGPRTTSEQVMATFDDIAETVTGALVRHIQSLAPRTLLFVLGDHGFSIDRSGHITNGGASPEEVLVPSFAYLIGDSH
ncbi:MAG: hypothetical protein FWD69_01155 [Polyangiaceae bacterium]|nr:hypothetical protein [Polyangiaceae bacterium]